MNYTTVEEMVLHLYEIRKIECKKNFDIIIEDMKNYILMNCTYKICYPSHEINNVNLERNSSTEKPLIKHVYLPCFKPTYITTQIVMIKPYNTLNFLFNILNKPYGIETSYNIISLTINKMSLLKYPVNILSYRFLNEIF